MKMRAQLILMLILMILVMMSGCGTDSVEYDTEYVPNNRILSGKKVYVNDNYHFTLPKGTKRAETRFDEDSIFSFSKVLKSVSAFSVFSVLFAAELP